MSTGPPVPLSRPRSVALPDTDSKKATGRREPACPHRGRRKPASCFLSTVSRVSTARALSVALRVVCGFTDRADDRNQVGSLLLGVYDGGALIPVGKRRHRLDSAGGEGAAPRPPIR